MKINDGLVLAADSASTIIAQGPAGQNNVINVYDNANKVFNLKKGLPIGAITWGFGSIGLASISTLMKDLRRRFSDQREPEYKEWVINPSGYTIEQVAGRVREFFYDERHAPAFKDWVGTEKPQLGFIVGGYSFGSATADEYYINIGPDGQCALPTLSAQTGRKWGNLVWRAGGNKPSCAWLWHRAAPSINAEFRGADESNWASNASDPTGLADPARSRCHATARRDRLGGVPS